MLTNLVNDQLKVQNMKPERFREIVARLFAWGVFVRTEDGIEQKMYDDARRIEDVLVEYFSLGGFRLEHDRKNEFFRLYPPGAQVPGLPADETNEPVPALRARVTADFVAASLALRFMYQQGLSNGGSRLADTGDVLIAFEDLASTMQTQLKRALPESALERKNLLNELKRHRLITFNSNFSPTDEDSLIAIRPTILGIVNEASLGAALEDDSPLIEEVPAEENSSSAEDNYPTDLEEEPK